jgi:hypothetical protein
MRILVMSSPAASPDTSGLTSSFFFLFLRPGFRLLEQHKKLAYQKKTLQKEFIK